jgi:hypothetical protein
LISKPAFRSVVALQALVGGAPRGRSASQEGVRDAAPGQANVARLRYQAAMVNESHALDAPLISTPPRRPDAAREPDEEHQKSSLLAHFQ